MNVLVLCTGNSARSILLESLLNRLGQPIGLSAFSAGSHPTGRVHPEAARLLAGLGYPTGGLRSKSWDEFALPGAPVMDMVITVCASAAGEACPLWPGAPLKAHWGVDDPAALPQADQPVAFRATFDILERRARALVALDLAGTNRDRLAAELDRIGRL